MSAKIIIILYNIFVMYCFFQFHNFLNEVEADLNLANNREVNGMYAEILKIKNKVINKIKINKIN